MDDVYRPINIGDYYEGKLRENAAVAVLAWLYAGEYSFEALDALVQGASATADIDIGPDQEYIWNETWNSVADFLIMCGAEPEAVQELFDSGDADRAQRMANFVKENPAFIEKSDQYLAATFISGGDPSGILEEGMTRKVVDGVVKWVRKKHKIKRMSSAMKRGLEKARKMAQSGMAKLKRMKSMKKRKSAGLDK